MYNSAIESEQLFRDWMRRQVTAEGMRRYTDNAIIAYSHALRTSCSEIILSLPGQSSMSMGNLFYFSSAVLFDSIYEEVVNAPAFEQANSESGHGTLLAAMQLYQFFLHNGTESTAPEISAPFYLKKDASLEKYSENQGEEFHYEEIPMAPLQKIYYGVPGTGKSYLIRNFLSSMYPDPEERDSHCRRLIFHPTYTYEDFVGCIKPLISLDKPLDYTYTAGPFTILLKEAFMHPAEKYYLVIEEINRGNAPAIFGDLFQLLDRQESGKSMYAVQNSEITAYFFRDPGLKNLFYEGKVWLPANFNILATMNTADENIFVLDNAFKRRFALEYVRINFDNLPESWSRAGGIFDGLQPLTFVFRNTPLENYANMLNARGKLERSWPAFAMLANRLIDTINQEKRASGAAGDALIAENKKLGPFFVSEADLSDRNAFVNKVVFYLKQDVFSASARYMTASYEEISEKYLGEYSDLFELLR